MAEDRDIGLDVAEDSYRIRLDEFEGPLDLLLHLIKKNEINIYDIPIALITKQYLDYISTMKSLNLVVAGEFLVMAATLIHIKSRVLLPVEADGDEEDEAGEDPRAQLVRERLEQESALPFDALFSPDEGRLVVIVTFLGLLELMRIRLVRAFQAEAFGPILLSRAFLPVTVEGAESGENTL